MNDYEEQKNFVKYLEKKFLINKTSDWHLLTSKKIRDVITMPISDVMTIVKKFYPDLNMNYFQSLGVKKSQYDEKLNEKNVYYYFNFNFYL